MSIILDTGVLWRPQALDRLQGQRAPLVLPSVALAERARQYRKKGWPVDRLLQDLDDNGISIETLGPLEALRRAPSVLDDVRWQRHCRDALIAGHIGPDDMLWTTNPRDFLELGVPPDQVVTA